MKLQILTIIFLIFLAGCSSTYTSNTYSSLSCPSNNDPMIEMMENKCDKVPAYFDASTLHKHYPVDEMKYPALRP